MPTSTAKLTTAVEEYFSHLRLIRASGGATGELSTYPALANLLDAVGATLKPKVFCVVELANQGAGHPDIGLYASGQVQKGKPLNPVKLPERGVVEVKGPGDDAWLTADSRPGQRLLGQTYRLVLVTNTRDFVLLGEDAARRTRPSWRRSGWPTLRASSRPSFRSHGRSLARSAPDLASTCAGRYPIAPRLWSPATSRGCWRRTRGTAWRAWRQPERLRRLVRRYGRHWRRRWE